MINRNENIFCTIFEFYSLTGPRVQDNLVFVMPFFLVLVT